MALNSSTIQGLVSRMARSSRRYGPIVSTHEGLGVALEEWDELRDAVRENDHPAIERECLDLAAVLIRMAEELSVNTNTQHRSRK